MQTWVFKAIAHRLGEEPRDVIALASGLDEPTCRAFALEQMALRGWIEVQVSRSVELDPSAKVTANDYLRRAIETVATHGFSFVRYGSADH